VAVKLSPFLSAIPNIAMRLAKAGAKGLVLFNVSTSLISIWKTWKLSLTLF